MSFRCADCGKPSKKTNHVTVETRPKTYMSPETNEIIGKGHEIVREVIVCNDCNEKRKADAERHKP